MIQPSLTGLVRALFATQHCVLGLEFLHFLDAGVWFIELRFWVLLCIRARLQSCP